ncbi:MAG: T9SS type A sorting domain-containing protein [Lewinellaceae bacterium]|nr:T9SS type A sorting domain-containing protein [Lewinellaceae bacterium]
MAFCVLGSVFTAPSTASIFYTDTHWEGKVGELLFFDHDLSDAQMKGVSEFLRQKWISTADLMSPKLKYHWPGTTRLEEDVPENTFVTMYPNPVSGTLFLERSDSEALQVEIYNAEGKLFRSKIWNGTKQLEDVSDLPSGFYWIRFRGVGGMEQVARFVKM